MVRGGLGDHTWQPGRGRARPVAVLHGGVVPAHVVMGEGGVRAAILPNGILRRVRAVGGEIAAVAPTVFISGLRVRFGRLRPMIV